MFQGSYGNSGTEPDGYSDLMGWGRLLWDDTYLYGLFYTQDDILVDTHANFWERDGWEFFIDVDNSKGSTDPSHNFDTVNDIQVCIPHGAATTGDITTTTNGWTFDKGHVGFANVNDPSGPGWWQEWRIPLTDLSIPAAAGHLIGLEVGQDDNDSDHREHISRWWLLEGDASWNDVSTWGTAQLSASQSDGKAPAQWTTAAPVIDGQMDEVWRTVPRRISMNRFGNGPSWPGDYSDLYGEYRLMWDAQYLYGYFGVWDETLVDSHTNPWEKDGWEVYCDGDNSKGTAFDGVNDLYLRINHGYTLPSEIDATEIFSRTGVEFVNRNTDTGWDLEFKIPLSSLFLSPVSGSVFGLEAMQNDNDGSDREHIAKWWLDAGDETWHDPSTFGTAVLAGAGPSYVYTRIRVWLGGPYQTGGSMTTALKTGGSIPLTSPYADGRTVTSVPTGVTDWVSVELRSSASGPSVAQRSFFLRSDGNIADTDGTTTNLQIPGVTAGSYYLVVRHRNHLAVMSASALPLTAACLQVYDFTTGSGQYYGSNGSKQLETTAWGMWAGDVNQDRNVTTTDYTAWYNSARLGESGYRATDINMDGVLNTSDYTIWYNNARLGAASSVP
jgi:hypothetical protein